MVQIIFMVLFSMRAFGATITPPNLPNPLPASVDALDFFVPFGSAVGWIIGGHQTEPLPSPWGTQDPENTKLKTYAMVKFNDPGYFEAYKVDRKNIYIRYEASPNSVRGFDTKGNKKGALFVLRKVPSSGSKIVHSSFSGHIFSRSKSNWYLDETFPELNDISEYKLYPASDSKDSLGLKSYLKSCNCGLDNIDVLLHISYWQSTGRIAEYYSYGYGVGFVAWRWVENITVNGGAAVQRNPDGSGLYTCYLQNQKVTIKNWDAVLGSSTKSVAPEAYVSLKSKNDTRVFISKLNNPNINQSDWYVTCRDGTWQPLTARQGTFDIDLGESSLPLPEGIFTLPFEYPSNLRTDATFYKDDGKQHKIIWDRAVVTTTPSRGIKYVQSYKVVIKHGRSISGTYLVSNGTDSFAVPADYAPGKYKAYVSAQEGSRQEVASKLSFTIY